ncbi:MAG TPA: aromatic amino acid hydroxylase [Polyangiales bacterium]
MSSAAEIPPHLRKYVVEQDYAAYTERDQAVWRFVVGHTHQRLLETAHSSYASGFTSAGISTQRIPELRAMDAHLSELGFRVVCVDGFIPPRAFQAFQARGVLPVAADMRRAEHLTYTPAPDIIHEAAGHAPFLAHPDYARFLRRIGAVSERAFESARDRALYRVIHQLSELKEQPDSTPAQIAAAEAELLALRRSAHTSSEATRMARLYWWTVEYGLVGSPAAFQLYGAGLLSSIGEAHFCHDPAVRKLPLTRACVDVDYDITQAQPQLFVAEDFAQLDSVLSEVEQTLSHVRGGALALGHALDSEEPATFTLDAPLTLTGTLRSFDDGLLRLSGACALASAMQVSGEHPIPGDGYLLPLGALRDGTPLSALGVEVLQRHRRGSLLQLRTQGGVEIDGELEEIHARDGRLCLLSLRDVRVRRGGELLLECHDRYPLLLASRVVTAAPLVPDGYYPATEYPTVRVPKARCLPGWERGLIALHQAIGELAGLTPQAGAARGLEVHAALASFPNEWLLRLNLLETLLRLRLAGHPLTLQLKRELLALEAQYQGREPIATGLEHIASLRAGAR